MSKKIIEEAWDEFKKSIPVNAHPRQFTDMRNAFYAGSMCMFSAMTSGLSEGEEAQESDFQRLDALEEELRAWIVDLKMLEYVDQKMEEYLRDKGPKQ